MGKWRDTPPSGLDAQRELLDQLMGINRNNDRDGEEIDDFHDERVCKSYLCGLCTHDLFGNTKMDKGVCPLAHDDDLKKQYEDKCRRDPGADKSYGWLSTLERELEQEVSEVDRKIQRSQRRLDEDNAAAGIQAIDSSKANSPEVIRIEGEIAETIKQAEAAGEQGDVDEAQVLMEKVEGLQRQKAEAQARSLMESGARNPAVSDLAGVNPNQKLRVCDVCGAFLSIFDSDQLADHFGGKLHIGFMVIRQKLDEIRKHREDERIKRAKELEDREKKRRDQAAAPVEDSRDKGRDRDRESDSRRSTSHSHSHRDKDRDRERDRHQDRDRERGAHRDREREKGHRRGDSRERPRGDRSRSRDRARKPSPRRRY